MARSSNRYAVALVVLAAVGLFACISSLLTPAVGGLAAKYKSIQYGQTRPEVEAFLGPPDRESHDIAGFRTVLVWQEQFIFVHVILEPPDGQEDGTPVVQRRELLDFTPPLSSRMLRWFDEHAPHTYRR